MSSQLSLGRSMGPVTWQHKLGKTMKAMTTAATRRSISKVLCCYSISKPRKSTIAVGPVLFIAVKSFFLFFVFKIIVLKN